MITMNKKHMENLERIHIHTDISRKIIIKRLYFVVFWCVFVEIFSTHFLQVTLWH